MRGCTGSVTLAARLSLPLAATQITMCSRAGNIRPSNASGLQTSLIAGTLFQTTHLALTIWFLAIYLVSQAKTGLSALDLKRQLGVSYPTAWLVQQKLMQAMVERDAQYTLNGDVQVDDAYLRACRTFQF